MDKKYEVKQLNTDQVADYQIKVVFLGNSGVGKTSVIKFEIDNKFQAKTQPTSIFQYFSNALDMQRVPANNSKSIGCSVIV